MESKWDLKKYFYESYSSEEFKKDEKLIEIETEKFIKKYKDKIKNIEKSEDLILFLEDESNLYKLSYKVGVYLNYLSYLDTQNQDTLKKLGEFEVKEIQRSTKLIFVEDEFKQLGYDKLIEFSKRNELKEYSNFFLQKAKSIKYQLDSKTEEALTIKSSSSSSAMVKLYDELLGSFEFEWQEKKVTEDELIVNLMSPDRKIREKAYHTLREVFNQKQNRIAISNSYSTIVSDWTSEIKLRKFDDVIAQRYLSEELSLKSVKLLLSSVKEMYPLYHEFLKIKQKLLNLDSLKPWDLYAPLDKVFKEISFEDGFNQVLNVLKEFDSEFYSFSKEMVKEGRVDVFPNTNKRV